MNVVIKFNVINFFGIVFRKSDVFVPPKTTGKSSVPSMPFKGKQSSADILQNILSNLKDLKNTNKAPILSPMATKVTTLPEMRNSMSPPLTKKNIPGTSYKSLPKPPINKYEMISLKRTIVQDVPAKSSEKIPAIRRTSRPTSMIKPVQNPQPGPVMPTVNITTESAATTARTLMQNLVSYLSLVKTQLSNITCSAKFI